MKQNFNKMSYGNLLRSIPEGFRTEIRKYESLRKKLINLDWSLKFNQICLKEEILPNYSRLRHHDPAVALTETTLKYRTYLVERELHSKRKQKENLELQERECSEHIKSFACDHDLKTTVCEALDAILNNYDNIVKTRTVKKLNELYYGRSITDKNKSICVKSDIHSFINLSDYELSSDEKEFLNLGLNCHLQPKYDKLHKQTEIESSTGGPIA